MAPGGYSLELDRVIDALNRGEGPRALAAYEQVAAEAESRGDRLVGARAHGATAATALRLGLFQKAIQAGNRSITLFRDGPLDQVDAGRLASVYSQLGAAYRAAGDLPRARRVLEEAMTAAGGQLRGPREQAKLAMLSRALATVALAEGDYAAALDRGTQAAQLFEDALADLPPAAPGRRLKVYRRQAALSLSVAGRALVALGRPDEAQGALDRALKLARSTGLREVEVDVLQVQGRLALARNDFAKARDLDRQGIALATQINRPGALVWLQEGLARALDGLGRADEALVAAREAVRLVEALRAGLGESELRSGFVEDKRGIYQHAARLALRTGRPDEAFALAERGRARAFLDLLGTQTRLSKGATRDLVDEEARLRGHLAESEGRAQDAGGEETEDTRPADLPENEYQAFLEKVRRASPEQASLMTVEPVTLAQVQALLPKGTTLVEYLVGETDTIVWAVDRQRLAVHRIKEGREALIARVARFRSAIAEQAALAEVEAQARELHALLVEPVRADLRGDRLLVVPHDVLHYVPFAALRTAGGRWLMEEYMLATLPSASVLQFLGSKAAGSPAGLKALAVGNPSLGEDRALRWAEREARAVGDRFPGSWVLVRDQATKAKVTALGGQAGLIHFATHGELDRRDPLGSALLLTRDGQDDGRLTVRDIFTLDLRARLVVLSACETGLGQLSRGDELVGLQRAFLYAGTPAVVTTLWRVDDRASFLLMREFYARLAVQAGKLDAPEALRAARAAVLGEFPHPFAWGAFELVGVGG